MEANRLDLSRLKLSMKNGDNDSDDEMQQEEKTVVKFSISENFIVDHKERLVYLMADFSDGTNGNVWIPYNLYFVWLNEQLNHPDYAKHADVVTMKERMEYAAPYNVFFSTLKHCPETREQLYSIHFRDLLCPSLGKLKSSFHITFTADIAWILTQFAQRNLHKLPMTVIYGIDRFAWPEKKLLEKLYPEIDYYLDKKENEADLGCHHTNLSIYLYEDDSLRIIIGSPDLTENDWGIYNEQIWISPRCPKLPKGSLFMSGNPPTGFKLSLLEYLAKYKQFSIPSLNTWIERVKRTDFSEIKVALVYTVPGLHYPKENGSFLHYIGHLLSRDCTIPAPKEEHDSWRIIAQTSSLGLVGHNPDVYLTTHLLKSLGSHQDNPYLPTRRSFSETKFSLIYPTVKNTFDGYLGLRSAGCCIYEEEVKAKQPWLLEYSCQWKADRTKRTRAIAHSKCYCRISPCWEKMAYYFLTTGNLSRSAWGKVPRSNGETLVRSFEIGVLFLPKYFGEEYFEVKDTPNRKNKKLFPIMFDLPLVPYGPDDDSFCAEELFGIVKDETDSEEEDLCDADNTKENTVKSSVTGNCKKSDDAPSTQSHKTDNKNKTESRPNAPVTLKKDVQPTVKSEVNTKENTVKSSETGDCKKSNDASSTQSHKTDNKNKTESRPNAPVTPKKDVRPTVKSDVNMFFPTFGKKP